MRRPERSRDGRSIRRNRNAPGVGKCTGSRSHYFDESKRRAFSSGSRNMDRRLILLVMAALVISSPVSAAAASESGCTSHQNLLGECPPVSGGIVGGGVQLVAETTTPGSGNGNGGNRTG